MSDPSSMPVSRATERPVVTFLRLAGWSEGRIKEVTDAHDRGEVYEATVVIPGLAAMERVPQQTEEER